MTWQHGLASHGSTLQAGKVARMSSRRSSAAARQSVKRDSLASCILTNKCQLFAKRRLFQLCLFCLRITQLLYLEGKNIDRKIPLHTPFTFFFPVPADFRAGVRVTFDWTRVHIVRTVFALFVFDRCSLSLGARCG